MCQLVQSLLQTWLYAGIANLSHIPVAARPIQVSGRGASTTIVASMMGLARKGHDVKIGLRQ
jgi:hypothetical protein